MDHKDIVKMCMLPKGHLQIQFNPNQNANGILHRNRKILKFVWKTQKTPGAKARKTLEALCFLISNYTIKLVIKMILYWHKNRHKDQ